MKMIQQILVHNQKFLTSSCLKLNKMTSGTTSGLFIDVLWLNGEEIYIVNVFTQFLKKVKIFHLCWAMILLLHKKGGRHNIGNYSPIIIPDNLQSTMTDRISSTLETAHRWNWPQHSRLHPSYSWGKYLITRKPCK